MGLRLRTIILVALMWPILGHSFSFTVGTQNLWHSKKGFEIRQQNLFHDLRQFVPDIMAFQETWTWWDKDSLYRDFLNFTGFQHNYINTRNKLFMVAGMAVASKYKVNHEFDAEIPHSKFMQRRRVHITKVPLPTGHEILVVNVHMTPFKRNSKKRADQLKYIFDLLNTKYQNERNIVFLGDFNLDQRDLPLLEPFRKHGYQVSLDPKTCTFCAVNPYTRYKKKNFRFDFLMFKMDDFKKVKSGLLFDQKIISDHYGIWSEFTLK